MTLRRIIDAALEVPVVPSFTRLGHDVRSRTDSWTSLDDYDLTGRTIVLTGGTSGLGRAAATQLVRCGAEVTITGRDPDRTTTAAQSISLEAADTVHAEAADIGELDQVRSLAAAISARHDQIDVLIHNAGALSARRHVTSAGHEATVASQVYGPFLLTALLLDQLATASAGRVLTMSSGGMYAANLTVTGLEMDSVTYNGTRQYASAKRAQVTLNELWAKRHGDRAQFHAVHPGWADTPGVADALPGFGKVLGPLLRTPEQGADTIAWLAADEIVSESNGDFWHDRRRRSIHKSPVTRASDTDERRARLWDHVVSASGAELR